MKKYNTFILQAHSLNSIRCAFFSVLPLSQYVTGVASAHTYFSYLTAFRVCKPLVFTHFSPRHEKQKRPEKTNEITLKKHTQNTNIKWAKSRTRCGNNAKHCVIRDFRSYLCSSRFSPPFSFIFFTGWKSSFYPQVFFCHFDAITILFFYYSTAKAPLHTEGKCLLSSATPRVVTAILSSGFRTKAFCKAMSSYVYTHTHTYPTRCICGFLISIKPVYLAFGAVEKKSDFRFNIAKFSRKSKKLCIHA